ncbi:MAG: putative quinol monooxygenase, partial [Solirubrobacterales bacterium]
RRTMPELCVIDWHVHPKREERWYAVWRPATERALSFGARSYSLTRSEEDPLHFRQSSVWEEREDFERYWSSDEISAARQEVMSLYNKPAIPGWHTLLVTS